MKPRTKVRGRESRFPLIASEFYRKITTGLAFQPWPGMRVGKKTESPVFIIASQSTRNPIVTPLHCKRRCKKTRETEKDWNSLSPFPVKEDRPWRLLENCLCVREANMRKVSSHTWMRPSRKMVDVIYPWRGLDGAR